MFSRKCRNIVRSGYVKGDKWNPQGYPFLRGELEGEHFKGIPFITNSSSGFEANSRMSCQQQYWETHRNHSLGVRVF